MSDLNKGLKKLVVYYSFEGNTKLIAQSIADEIGADILELKPKKELKSKGFTKYLWGGSQVMMKKKPELMPMEISPKEYDVIFLGTPVWAWTYAPPLKTFFEEVDLSNKKIALFTCHGGQNGKTFRHMRETLKGNTIIGEKDFYEPLTEGKEKKVQEARGWAKEIL